MATPRSAWRTILVSVAVTGVTVLPVWLVGALGVQLMTSLAFSASGLGGGVAIFFAASALTSVPAGRLVERLTLRHSLSLAAALASVCMFGVGRLATSWHHLVAFLIIGGIANAVGQPAANRALSHRVPRGRQGLAFGIKQAAAPVATLLAGLAVPLIALTIGWRYAFGAAAGLATALAVGGLKGDGEGRFASATNARHPLRVGRLTLLACAGGLGTAAANSFVTFIVVSAVDSGTAPQAAGLILAGGSVIGISARIAVGWLADSFRGAHLMTVAGMMAVGAIGLALLSNMSEPAFLLVGTVLAFGAGFAWNGLFTFAVVRQNREAPAAATGVTQAGLYLGGGLGPLGFGLVAERTSFSAAWASAAATLCLGSLIIYLVAKPRT